MLNNKDYKVKPGEKKVESVREKAVNLLKNHPEFHVENATQWLPVPDVVVMAITGSVLLVTGVFPMA